MGWLRSFWQKAKKPLEVFGVIVICALVIALVVAVILAYIFKVNVSGLTGKNIWDWLQLLIIPAVLAVGGYLFNFATSRNEQSIASDNQSEAAMKEYFDKMSELLLHEKLRGSGKDDEVRMIARVLTLTVFRRCDEKRKAIVLQFLYESGLIEAGKSIVDLNGADLSGAFFFRANLFEANLFGADLRGADLGEADLRATDLSRANVTFEQLKQAKSLQGAIMPDGTRHP